ncbi:MAG: helix-turn-helix domain-containing protein [Acidimicrobiales bacterium]
MSVWIGWNAKLLLAERGIWKAPQLVEAFDALGIGISREHAWRLMSKPPKQVSLEYLTGLCLVCGCDLHALTDFRFVADNVHELVVNGDNATDIARAIESPAPAPKFD